MLIGIALFVWLLFGAASSPTSAGSPPRQAATPGSPRPGQPRHEAAAPPAAGLPARIVFRPVAETPRPRAPRTSTTPAVQSDAFAGLRDAVTGAPIDKARRLFQCRRCEVLYHEPSLALLREANRGQCVSCLGTDIAPLVVKPETPPPAAPAWQALRCTLADYRQRVGQVVVFEGRCVRVIPSRSGKDHAVMFENLGWKRGFKMIVFRRDVESVGGAAFLRGLAGRNLTVRGLIVKHPVFGYQIVVTDRSMIGVA